MTAMHGYGPYSRGCRCAVCRAAKAAYMRERRAAGTALLRAAQTRQNTLRPVSRTARHGTRAGYEEHGCRCKSCRLVHNASDRKKGAQLR